MKIVQKLNKLIIIAFLLLLPILTIAADQVNVIGYTPFAYEKITVTTATVSRLDSTYRESAGAVFITVETNNIRYRIEGGDPDSNDGHLVVASAYQNIWLNDPMSIRNFRALAITNSATLIVTYYRNN